MSDAQRSSAARLPRPPDVGRAHTRERDEAESLCPTGPFRALQSQPPHNYDLTLHGDRFLMLTVLDPSGDAAPIVVQTNWSPPDL
jgi:hypothetical protein